MTMNEMLTFIYVLRSVRPDLIKNTSPKEEAILSEHFEYLKRGLQNGLLVLAGPCLDGTFGIVIFLAHSEDEAGLFMKDDPAVKGGLMTGELHPFRISLMENVFKEVP